MAVSVKSTYGDPEYFRDYLEVGGNWGVRVDAAPIYEGLRLKRTIIGSGVQSGSSDYEYHYSFDHTFEEIYSREPTRGSPVDGISTLGVTGPHDGGSRFSNQFNPPSEGCCLIQVRIGNDLSHLPILFVTTPPARPSVIVGSYDTYYTGGVYVGTTDVYSAMNLDPPEFTWIGAGFNRERDNRWGFVDNYVDISGWTMAQWRDLRGVHTLPGYPGFGFSGVTITDEFEVF